MESLETINKSIQIAYGRCQQFNKIEVSLSGGSDSDIMLDLLLKVCPKEKINFVFFDTGIEYQATKKHLDYLEEHYDIKIERRRALKPVPLGCKEYGQPFISKFISTMISRLQKANFDFKNDGNKEYEELIIKYPNCKGALTWWTNTYESKIRAKSIFNISNCKYLKEFMIQNPPTFMISPKCCDGAKKNTGKMYDKEIGADLKCVGIRKAEGGIRSTAYKTCFDYNSKKKIQSFRPIFWFTDADKKAYDEYYQIKHSECYTKYGMLRTGCAGCPFNSKFEEDLKIVEQYEPKLYKAVNNVFGDSYEYTRKYRKFKEEMKIKAKQGISQDQISIFDLQEENYGTGNNI